MCSPFTGVWGLEWAKLINLEGAQLALTPHSAGDGAERLSQAWLHPGQPQGIATGGEIPPQNVRE